MFNAGKRRRRASDSACPSRRRLGAISGPLEGLVICLTGLPAEEKTRLHRIVDQLGGSYARDLDTSKTTHLIVQSPEGAKYNAALSCSRVSIVTPQWLTASLSDGRRADESKYSLKDDNKEQDKVDDLPCAALLEQLLKENKRSKLFYPCRILLLGFEEEDNEVLLLEKLIRRGQGTIYYEINESITHVVVKDGSDQALADAAETISVHHPLGPPFASPRWIIESWKVEQILLTSDYRPRKPSKVAMIAKKVAKEPKQAPKNAHATSLFRGSLFCLVRLAPPQGAVDFDASRLTQDIVSNGGQMVSQKVVDALRTDQRQAAVAKRTCFVVFWGGYTKTHISIHALLSQISKDDLCTLVPVSVIWLKAAIADGKLPSRSKQPLLFQPQPWPLRQLNQVGKTMKLSVTGFVHSERTAVIQLIRAVGASYTENMKPSNSHLICRQAQGPKYEKAIEWNLHIVSIEWLYHVVRYGYGGEKGTEKTGCEHEFSLVPSSVPKAVPNGQPSQEAVEVAETQHL